AEVVAVREDLGLERQERAAGVDEVETGKTVLLRHLLQPQVLLDRQREVGAALDGRVVGDDRALTPFDDADPRDDPRRRRIAVVDLPGGEGAELEEGRTGVDEAVDPLAREQLSTRPVTFDRTLAAAACDLRRPLAQLGDEALHPGSAAFELV